MGKQKFIDKKNSATYHILARDSSDPNYSAPGPAGDRVFVRVDNNQDYNLHGFSDEEEQDEHQNTEDPNSIFADAAEEDGEYAASFGFPGSSSNAGGSSLPDHVRREIIELGFPDDGYNYLTHLREIKNTGGGSFYYENPKAKFEQLPPDVKAYNASRVDIPRVVDNSDETLYTSVSNSVKARIERVVDDEVAALLDDDSDASLVGSDIEDLEEDFVVKANLPEGPVELEFDKKLSLREEPKAEAMQTNSSVLPGAQESMFESMQRPRRMIDDQFDMLKHQEYDTESEDEYGDYDYDAGEYEPQESLAEKLNHGLKHNIPVDDMDGKYRVPSDLLQEKKGLEDLDSPATAAAVIQRTKEYGETYENQSDEEKEVVFVESSDESEAWDCDTIVTTYTVHENHPGKIETPGARRKKKLTEAFPATLSSGNIITLKGKDKLPVDFLPSRKNPAVDKVKDADVPKPETIKRKQHGQESKEEKKERKALVKEERREARKTKKEIRGRYQTEVQRAQKFAAVSGPSSIHIM